MDWLDALLLRLGIGPGLLSNIRLVALLLLVAVLSWAIAPLCRSLARRLRRRGRKSLPAVLSASAGRLRLVVLLSGLYYVAIWAWRTPSAHDSLISGALFIAAVIVATATIVQASQAMLEAAVDRLVGLEARAGRVIDERIGHGIDPGSEPGVSQRAIVPLSQKIATVALWLCALLVMLDHFGQSVTSVVTALGVGSLAIGLAAQQALSNMIAGVVLLIDKPFRAGDRVRLPGLEIGRVEDIGMRATRIRLGDGNLLVVPNNELVSAKLVNYCAGDGIHGEVRLQVPLQTDVDELSRLLEQAALAEGGVHSEPPPRMMLLALGDKLDLSLVFLLDPAADAPKVAERLRRVALDHLRSMKR